MQRADMRSKRSGAVSMAHNVSVGLLALTLACLHSSAYGQSADLVLCDRLAADPSDPDKPKDVKGTHEIEASDVATAIKFCKIASAASRRALYQLGRAYAANQQLPEAVGAYRKAADKGSTSAWSNSACCSRPDRALPRMKPRRASCSSAPPRAAMPAAPAISRPSAKAAARRRIQSRPERGWRKRRKRTQPKRNTSSD